MNKPFKMTEISQVDALSSPVRGEIIDVVDLMGPSSIAEIAGVTGRPIDSLYYHVRKLLKVGLLIETGKRKATRQAESVYDLAGRPMSLEYDPSDISFTRQVIRSIAGMLRLTGRDFNAAFDKHLVRDSGHGRNIIHSRALGWFTDQEIGEIRTQIQETIASFRSSTKTRKSDSRLYALTTILVPIDKKGSRGNGATGFSSQPRTTSE